MQEKPFSDLSFEEYLREDKLMGSRCQQCRTLYVPPRPICVKCQKDAMVWEEMTGAGKLAAFTCISIGPSFMIAQGYNRNNPYCSGVVELEEGGRVDARIEGVDCSKPEEIKIGMPLKVKYLHRQEGVKKETYLAFEPVSG
jgi:uncharacterized OB-fold protein